MSEPIDYREVLRLALARVQGNPWLLGSTTRKDCWTCRGANALQMQIPEPLTDLSLCGSCKERLARLAEGPHPAQGTFARELEQRRLECVNGVGWSRKVHA